MTKKTLIYYNSIVSFLFWIIKDTTLQKTCEIYRKNKSTYIKTDKYEGKLFSLNKYFILTVKYLLPVLALFMLFIFSTHLIEAYFIYGFPFILFILFFSIFYKDKQYRIFTIIFTILYFILSGLFILKYNLNFFFLLQLFFNSLHIFLCYLILFKIYRDFMLNKNRKFYFDRRNKIIIACNK